MVDYLVIGLGLAGISFCEQLEKNNKTFKVISDTSQTSSIVAGGLYNPVILKRFTLAWNAKHQLELTKPFYQNLEQKLKIKLDSKVPVYRRFASIEEQNMWFEAADKSTLQPFLSTQIKTNTNTAIDAPFGYGEVLGTGRIDTKALLKAYKSYLRRKEILQEETFNYDALILKENHVFYKTIKAKKIVFATGYGLKSNPYFNYLPLNGTKGELLTIKAPELKESNVIKSSVFIIPLGKDLYRVGATYKWKDKTNTPTEEAKEELLQKLDTFLKCDYEVVNHVAGIRPTVADRRPLLGRHPEHANMYVLNGFGSRGVMISPYASNLLLEYIESNKALPAEIDISRFTKKYYKPL
ncbi:glycine/D-amino acid oxidase-like deaminating enzyme [Maribacter vaceletii]|uniref:Glycine/D-amino acid oxidase-like deaminating enzyme n=1 Tax=Maribacter vaceletii TaxID=1206816 RepID=A0A495EEX5_9FLAO|nr:FAD-binding oxidoreductase [Maribacter vaceletii]RKR15316.1 glycine/D-amino acid oxidase-like deaminating enzyme [Maribacter vaceletii]